MLNELDWNLIPAFLATAETGSLSGAARRLGVSQPTVGRHIAELESALGVRLFDRTAQGLRITEIGVALLDNAGAMREQADGLRRLAESRAEAVHGTVRLTASEMAATYVLPRILSDLHEIEPRIEIELIASMTAENLLLREADIAVRMFRPEQNDVITRHVNTLQLGVFAHRDYIARRGLLTELSDITGHSVIGYDREDLMIRGFRRAGFEVDREFFCFRSDCQTAAWEMVKAGFGIGIGPVFLAQKDPDLVHLFPDAEFEGLSLPIWLTAHRDLHNSRRIRLVYDFLAERLGELDLRS